MAQDRIVPFTELPSKFRFIAEIGRGGMSEVYLTATRGGLGGFQKLVVVKLLRRDLAEDEEFLRMFLQEAKLTARLNHPNVVQTNDVGEDQGRYYMAMEYLEGQTFERVRRARDASAMVPLHMQLQVLVQALAGLHHAHELTDYDGSPLSIVHRDVTPSNIFVTYDGQVKLLDFGIAKVFDSLNPTRVGVLKGKARFMAPEQITCTPLDRRADLYSVGVILWEMLNGTQIWAGRSETDILRRVAAGETPPLQANAPEALQQICMKAMAHLPRDRHATAEALRGELEAYLAHHHTPSRERGVGAAITELFSEERTKIRQLIELQLREGRPSGTALPMLRDIREPTGSHSGTSSGANDFPEAQLAFGPAPGSIRTRIGGAPSPYNRARYYLAGAAVTVAALLATFTLMRDGGTPAPAAALAASSAATTPGEPARSSGANAEQRSEASEVQRSSEANVKQRTGANAVRGVTDTTLTLGMSAAFSGPSRELGTRMKLGLDTAFEEVNAAGGVAGRKLDLLALDDGYEGKRTLANVRELLEERKVFAIIGNVGTPTTKEALPYVMAQKTLFFGAYTGAALLRHDPPDRYVLNYRAGYEEETAKMVHYLIDVKKIPDRSIVVFAQQDAYGDAGYEGAIKALRRSGYDDNVLRVGYERNTLNIDDAVGKVVDYNNVTIRLSNDLRRPKHPVKAIIMIGTYKACAKFIQRIRDLRIDTLFLNVSFVGSNSLADELKELGPSYSEGVIVTQVVPHFDSGATGVIRYREALRKYHPDQQPDFVSLEGYIVGGLFAEGLRRAGRDFDTETLIDAFEQIRDFDPGTGSSMSFGMSRHQASSKVWGTVLNAQGGFTALDME